jgi:4-diphosphocytidyl-2-C-methyl-D-erythritol kinase
MNELFTRAHAKVNLLLEVREQEPSGYHQLYTVFDELELADELSYHDADGWGLLLQGDEVAGGAAVPAGEDNLVLRAARAFAESYGVERCGQFALRKRIPAGGGLGGGSSDAAAALRLLAQRHRVSMEDPVLHELARSIGADVAFFLVGGRAWADGRGDHIHAAAHGPGLSYVLLLPGYACPTGSVFATHAQLRSNALTRKGPHLDSTPHQTSETRGDDAGRTLEFLSSLVHVDEHGALGSRLSNDLDDAAHRVVPPLARLRQRLEGEKLPKFHLSGSGSTLYAALLDSARAQAIAGRVRGLLEEWGEEGFDGLGPNAQVVVTCSRHPEAADRA